MLTYISLISVRAARTQICRLIDMDQIRGPTVCRLRGIQAFYTEAYACVRVGGEFSESFTVEVGMRQGCVMSPWWFNIFMKCKMGNASAKLVKWISLICCNMLLCG